MSFWIDEEDDEFSNTPGPTPNHHSQRSTKEEEEGVEECSGCGGREFYHDNTTGYSVCAVCFTQSVTQTQASSAAGGAAMDYDDVMALAAKKGGRVVQRKRRKRNVNDKSWQLKGSEKKPLEPLDASVPLPDLETCLGGMQEVLQACAKALAQLLFDVNNGEHEDADDNDDNNSNFDANFLSSMLMQSVQTLWFNYLKSWHEGAEEYGQRYPDVRFSLRDHFLPTKSRKEIYRYLSYRIAKEIKGGGDSTVKSENNDNESPPPPKRRKRDPIFDNSSDEDDESPHGSSNPDPAMSTLPEAVASYPKHKAKVLRSGHGVIIDLIQQENRRRRAMYGINSRAAWYNRQEVALYVVPSMTMIAGLLWIAVARTTGTTPGQISTWIADDRIPLQNALRHIKNPSRLRALQALGRTVFSMKDPPTPDAVEHMGDLMSVACGIRAEGGQIKNQYIAQGMTRFRWLTPTSIPLVVQRIVSELPLAPFIIDYSLALMGLLERTRENGLPHQLWPTSTSSTLEDRIGGGSLAHILAIMLCAIQLDPFWRLRMFYGHTLTTQRCSAMPTTTTNTTAVDRSSASRIPENPQRARFMTNGDFAVFQSVARNVFLNQDQDAGVFPQVGTADAEKNRAEAAAEPVPTTSTAPFSSFRIRPLISKQRAVDYKVECDIWDPFRQLVLEHTAQNHPGARGQFTVEIRKQRGKRSRIVLDHQQDLLVERLAAAARVESKGIVQALPHVLGWKRSYNNHH